MLEEKLWSLLKVHWRNGGQEVRLREETLFMKRSFYLCKFLSA